MGDDPIEAMAAASGLNFYPRPPYGGRPTHFTIFFENGAISIHVPRMGDDRDPPRQGAARLHISIHVPRMGDDNPSSVEAIRAAHISIHVPRMGDDGDGIQHGRVHGPISIHVPRMGDDGKLLIMGA